MDFMQSELYKNIRYKYVPPVFVVVFTIFAQILVVIGNPEIATAELLKNQLGSAFAWKVVLFFYFWAFLSLKIPGTKTYKGPPTPEGGYVPVYAANGLQYYFISLLSFAVYASFIDRNICLNIYLDFAAIIAVLNITALGLCVWLMRKAVTSPEIPSDKDDFSKFPYPYQFYRGAELHPRIFDVDIKQWTNCRVGMMGWALLVIVFAVASSQVNGFSSGSVVNAFLINIYLMKFFHWETGYFTTLDITLDRAGYYLCWGCLCFVQVFYTFSSYYMVNHPSKCTLLESSGILVLGLISILLNYATDRQKEKFRESGGKCFIWGKPAKFLNVEYTDPTGKKKKSRLLLSGFWGVSRHLNYVFELMLAFSWSLPAASYGIMPFAYFFFLLTLLVHRTFRDDEKCKAKYGKYWDEYCKLVPYKMIPYLF